MLSCQPLNNTGTLSSTLPTGARDIKSQYLDPVASVLFATDKKFIVSQFLG